MKRLNVIEIVHKYMEENGYDGLHNDFECGCRIDDLAPCCETDGTCQVGYVVMLPEGTTDDYNTFWVCDSKDAKPWENDT